MTTTDANHCTDLPSNQVCHDSIPIRSAERNTLIKKRRSAAKLVDPIDILSLVVAGSRRNGKFLCPLCTKSFGRRCELKRHIAEVHTTNGARRFACKHPACGKSFTRKDALAKHHVVKHQGKKRFVCPTCSEKFTSRYDLSRHNIRVHSNVKKRFTCEFCSVGFSQKSQLTMHKGRVHSSSRNNESPSPQRCSPMDSLAAAAIAIAAKEEAAKRKDNIHATEFVAKSQESDAETLAAEALLEAAGVLEPVDELDSVDHKPLTHAKGEAQTSFDDVHG